jgi:excisionase family DNA binding protein
MSDSLFKPQHSPPPTLAVRSSEAARILGISKRTFAELVKDGEVPFARLRGVKVYPVESLARWLAERCNKEGKEGGA